jgi:hypothetical protein
MSGLIMKNFKFNTPILFMTFNRLDHTKLAFEEIRRAKPRKLFVASDGPRNAEEKKKTDAVRKYIMDNLDWKCDVKTLFREKNMGCRVACAGAVDWFFENVKLGIILEDDCVPDPSFFRFCQEMLERYKDDEKVASVIGYSAVRTCREYSYDFSKHIRLWGWASWRRSWGNVYRKEEKYMKHVESEKYLKKIFPNFFERVLFKKRFFDSIAGRVNTWEFPWIFGIIRADMVNITPEVNLVENIGVGEESTNMSINFIDRGFLALDSHPLKFPLRHPKRIKASSSIHHRLIIKDWIRILLKKLFFI